MRRWMAVVAIVAGCAAPAGAPPSENAAHASLPGVASPVLTLAPFVTAATVQVLAQPSLGGALPLVADFDGDGRADVLVAIAWDPIAGRPGALRFHAGRGDGTLAPPQSRVVGGLFHALVGDLDGDRRPDLMIDTDVLSPDGAWRALLGNGDGTFRDAFDAPIATPPESSLRADFDGDGRDDLTFAAEDSPRSVLLTRDGRWLAAPPSLSGNTTAVGGDFDRDGFADLVLIADNGTLMFERGAGDGEFPSGAAIRFEPVPCPGDVPLCDPIAAAVAADFDGDGALDLMISSPSGRRLLRNDGSGRFTVGAVAPSHGETQLWPADFDGDGRLDLLANGRSGATVLLDDGRALPLPGGPLASAALGDFDGDGRPDLAALRVADDGRLLLTIQLSRF